MARSAYSVGVAEDDEAHRKVAVKLTAVLAPVFFAGAFSLIAWALGNRGTGVSSAALGLALGLLIAALGQGSVWYLMHVRRPIHEPDKLVAPPPRIAADVHQLITKLDEYRIKLGRLLHVAENADAMVARQEATKEQLTEEAQQISIYLDLKCHTVSRIVAETGVYINFHLAARSKQTRILIQATGVLEDERDRLVRGSNER